MAIILTSFKKSSSFTGKLFSVAKTLPTNSSLPELNCFKPNQDSSTAYPFTSDSLLKYREMLSNLYKSRWNPIKEFLINLKVDHDYVLCCSCPYSPESEKQLKNGSFICHTGLIGLMIQKYRPDIEVIIDNDREKYLVTELKPAKSKCNLCEIYDEKMSCSLDNGCAGPYKTIEDGFETNHILHSAFLIKIDSGKD